MNTPSIMQIKSGQYTYNYYRMVIRDTDPLAQWMVNEAQDLGSNLNGYLKIVLRDRQQRQAKADQRRSAKDEK